MPAYTIRLSDDLRKAVRVAAAEADKSMNEFIIDCLKEKTEEKGKLTKLEAAEAAFDLGRFARGNDFVRVARRDDGSVYAFPCSEGDTFEDETLAHFDFSQINAADGERAVWDWLTNVI